MAPYQRATDVQLRAALLEIYLKGWMCKGVFCSSSIFMSFGCCLFQLLPAEGIYVNVPNTLSPLFVAIKRTQLGSRAGNWAGRYSEPDAVSWATSAHAQDPGESFPMCSAAGALGGGLFYKIFAPIPLCPTCFSDKEKLKTLPQPLTG